MNFLRFFSVVLAPATSRAFGRSAMAAAWYSLIIPHPTMAKPYVFICRFR